MGGKIEVFMGRGDQIYVIRKFLNLEGVYKHHGIDCGDGSVIHYRKTTETIERTPILDFSHGQEIYQYNYQACFIPDVVINRATTRLGEQKYNLLFNNCEHFATWCKTGVSRSLQVEDFIPVLNRLQVDNLYEPIKEALQGTAPKNTTMLLNEALAEIKVVWDDLQPKYKNAQKEMQSWQKVAVAALKQNREDLARQALYKKQKYQQQANELEAKLQNLATMTETLIRNSQDFNNH